MQVITLACTTVPNSIQLRILLDMCDHRTSVSPTLPLDRSLLQDEASMKLGYPSELRQLDSTDLSLSVIMAHSEISREVGLECISDTSLVSMGPPYSDKLSVDRTHQKHSRRRWSQKGDDSVLTVELRTARHMGSGLQ